MKIGTTQSGNRQPVVDDTINTKTHSTINLLPSSSYAHAQISAIARSLRLQRSMSDQRDAVQPSLSSSDAMSLSRFVELYSNALPQMVRVVSGFASVREPGCDCLSIVEANCSQVVAAETADGEAFLLPLNTTTKLSLIYNPTGDPREAVQGFVFKTVADLKVISPRPRLVCTKNSWIDPDHDDDDEPLLEANEILVLMEDETSAEGLSGLRVFSMNTRTTKFLPDHCSPVFSTAASRLSLHLPDILAYVSRPFPCEACIVRQREQQSCNRCYPANVVALTALTTSTVLRCLELSRRGGGASLVSTYYVPGDLPGVEVVVEETSGGQTCGSVFPAKDAFTGELSCQSDKDPSSAPSASNPSALAEQSTGRLTGDDVKVPVAPCGRDEDGSRTSLVAESNHLYETIADIPARCGLSRSLERSHTGSSNGSLKVCWQYPPHLLLPLLPSVLFPLPPHPSYPHSSSPSPLPFPPLSLSFLLPLLPSLLPLLPSFLFHLILPHPSYLLPSPPTPPSSSPLIFILYTFLLHYDTQLMMTSLPHSVTCST